MAEDNINYASAGKLERTYRLTLNIGARMMLRFGWGDGKNILELPGNLVGYQHYDYLLVQTRPAPGLLARIGQGDPVRVGFLSEGEASIFQTEVIGHLNRPSIILALAYPHTMNSVQVRKHKRVACALPVRVVPEVGDEQKISGIISDLSRGGCRLIIDVRGQSACRSLNVNDTVSLVVPLNVETDMENIQAIIKNIETEQHRMIMGLSFQPMSIRKGQLLESFLANTEILLS